MRCSRAGLPTLPDTPTVYRNPSAYTLDLNSYGEFTLAQRTWFITGVSSGCGRQLTDQLLEHGDCVDLIGFDGDGAVDSLWGRRADRR
jgi:hypothetical protein